MKFKIYLAIGVFTITFSVADIAMAQNSEALKKIQYPIAELGDCKNQKDCKKYCNDLNNTSQCLSFAEKYNLISKEEINITRKIGGKIGPGGCINKEECDRYCDKSENTEECISFAEKNGLITKKEADMVKKTGGKGPGGCQNDKECRSYCDNPEHMDECIDFGVKNGMISKKEADMVKKTGGKGPGGCRGKEECDTYCQQEEHMDECIDFGVKNGMINKEEAEMIKKTGGKGPGGCRGKEECDTYCQQEEHMDECIDFGVKNGMINKEEAEMAKKIKKMSGPGNCQGKEECDIYCDNPEHMDECVDFSVLNGMMPAGEAEKIKENFKKFGPLNQLIGPGGCGGAEECKLYCDNPEHQEECMKFSIEKGMMQPEEAQKIQMIRKGGPGGCTNKEECESFCNKPENSQECMLFAEEAEMVIPRNMPMMNGPGGCNTPEKCEKYCEKNQEECLRWGAQGKLPGIQMTPQSQGDTLKGPGECVDPKECRQYCEQNEHFEECLNFVMPAIPASGPMPINKEINNEDIKMPKGKFGDNIEIIQGTMRPPGGELGNQQIQMKRVGGGTMPVDMNGNPILDADGNQIIFIKHDFEKPPYPPPGNNYSENYIETKPPMPRINEIPTTESDGQGRPMNEIIMPKPTEYIEGGWSGEKYPTPQPVKPEVESQQWTENRPVPDYGPDVENLPQEEYLQAPQKMMPTQQPIPIREPAPPQNFNSISSPPPESTLAPPTIVR